MPKWSPTRWLLRSRSRSTASKTCSTCRRTRRGRALLDRGDVRHRHQSRYRAGAGAEPRRYRPAAPAADVRNIGVTVTTKSSPDLMMVVHLYSPDKSRDALFISNLRHAGDPGRVAPVSMASARSSVFGSRDYSMRIWLDPAPAAGARHDGDPPSRGAGGGEQGGGIR